MLNHEEIVEEGIVESFSKGTAAVRIIKTGACECCSARAICISDSDKNLISARSEYDLTPGDEVRVSIPGKNITSASTYIYGIPLLLIIAGLLFGHYFFKENKETYSAVISLLLIGIYGLIVYFYSKKKDFSSMMPRIVFVKKK